MSAGQQRQHGQARPRRLLRAAVLLIAAALFFTAWQGPWSQRRSGVQLLAFARKHAFPTGWRELAASLQSGKLSNEERAETIERLRVSYEEEIDKWGHRRQWQQAISFLQQMREQDVLPKSSTYTVLIKACADKAKRWQESLILLAEMKDVGLESDGEALSWAVTACTNAQKWRLSIDLMRELMGTGMGPHQRTYSSALRSCGLGGFWQDAVEILRDMEGTELTPTKTDYHEAMRACLKAEEDGWFDWVTDRAAADGVGIKLEM